MYALVAAWGPDEPARLECVQALHSAGATNESDAWMDSMRGNARVSVAAGYFSSSDFSEESARSHPNPITS
jgi:hypothetical protein